MMQSYIKYLILTCFDDTQVGSKQEAFLSPQKKSIDKKNMYLL